VCSVEAAGLRLRRAPLAAALAASRAAVPAVTPAAAAPLVRAGPPHPYVPRTHVVPPAPSGSPRERLSALSGVLSQLEPPAVVGPVDADRAARELLDYLRRSGCLPEAGPARAGGQP
jgi:electron transfer flavoprotein beta subunit